MGMIVLMGQQERKLVVCPVCGLLLEAAFKLFLYIFNKWLVREGVALKGDGYLYLAPLREFPYIISLVQNYNFVMANQDLRLHSEDMIGSAVLFYFLLIIVGYDRCYFISFILIFAFLIVLFPLLFFPSLISSPPLLQLQSSIINYSR